MNSPTHNEPFVHSAHACACAVTAIVIYSTPALICLVQNTATKVSFCLFHPTVWLGRVQRGSAQSRCGLKRTGKKSGARRGFRGLGAGAHPHYSSRSLKRENCGSWSRLEKTKSNSQVAPCDRCPLRRLANPPTRTRHVRPLHLCGS